MTFGSNPIAPHNHRCQLYVGDVLQMLALIDDESVDCIVTSPPYWGLRDYGTALWLEGDPGCDHVVGGAIRTPWANRIKGPNGGRTIAGYRDQNPARYVGGTCIHCGAVRHDYQIGLEPTLGQHLDVMVNLVGAELWRVLKPTGNWWLNYGDCYATSPNGRSADDTKAAGNDDRTFRDKPLSTIGPINRGAFVAEPGYQPHWSNGRGVFEGSEWNGKGYGTRRVDHGGRVVAGGFLKDKDLAMIPNRLAIALQEWVPPGFEPGRAGWWVRSEIVWGKTNPMPDSSGKQRPSTAHEKIFLLTKSADAAVYFARDTGDVSFFPDLSEQCPLITKPDVMANRWIRLGSYYDARAIMEESSPSTHPRVAQNVAAQAGSDRAHAGGKRNGPMKAVTSKIGRRGEHRNNPSYNAAMMTRDKAARHQRADGIGVDPRHDGHINHTGIAALGRGQGRLVRNYEPAPPPLAAPLPVWPMATKAFKDAHFATFPPELAERAIKGGCPPDGLVLDPFGGSGTTALMALRLGRRVTLIELKPEYAEMTQERIRLDWMGEDEARRQRAKTRQRGKRVDPGPLFEAVE